LLSPKFKRILAVDASSAHLKKAKERCSKAEFHESLIETFETQERFDTVTLLNILEHVIDPVSTLKKATSFLKGDGVLIAHVPNALATNRRIARLMGTLVDEYELSPYDLQVVGHRRSYDRNLLQRQLEAAGLTTLTTGGIFYKMLSTPQMDWLLKKGPWEGGGFGWGRIGAEKKDWRQAFCEACYEYGRSVPDDCNVVYACGVRALGNEENLGTKYFAEFEGEMRKNIDRMGRDRELANLGLQFIHDSIAYKYSYNFSWLGSPIIQMPQDILALEEITWKTRPDLIVETGIAHGGGLIFYASMLELLGGNRNVLGVDIEIRPHARAMLKRHPLSKRIATIEGSSTDESVVKQVYDFAKGRNSVMVVLDSYHTQDHVSRELVLYSPLVTKGNYLVVLDTTIEDLPEGSFPNRPWGKGNNPKTAVHAFLRTNDRFEIDKGIQNKLVITTALDGYLKCVKD